MPQIKEKRFKKKKNTEKKKKYPGVYQKHVKLSVRTEGFQNVILAPLFSQKENHSYKGDKLLKNVFDFLFSPQKIKEISQMLLKDFFY